MRAPGGTGWRSFRSSGYAETRLLKLGPSKASPSNFEAQSLGEVLSFMRLLWAVAHGLESASKQMRSEIGVTGPQRLVLRLIGHYERLSPGDLAELMHVHPSSLTGVLRRLERAGLMARKSDPEDGRRAILTLTASGRKLNGKRARTVEASVRRTLASLPASRIEAARELLSSLATELGAERS
jgi:MarR family transcriptional regulator, organic hydroperoxide resistance regulator